MDNNPDRFNDHSFEWKKNNNIEFSDCNGQTCKCNYFTINNNFSIAKNLSIKIRSSVVIVFL